METLHSLQKGETVGRKELAEYLAVLLGIPQPETLVLVNIIMVYMQDCLLTGNNFQLSGIGTLHSSTELQKKVRNPCGNSWKIKPIHNRIKFVMSNTLRNLLEGKTKATQLSETVLNRFDLMQVVKLREKLGIDVGTTIVQSSSLPEEEYLRAFTEHQGAKPESPKFIAYGKYIAKKKVMKKLWKKK